MAKRKVRNIRRAEPETEKPPGKLRAGATALAVVREPGIVVPFAPGFRLSVNGLVVDGTPSLEESDAAGTVLVVAERSSGFAIGDFVNYVEARFGEEASQIIDESHGWSLQTVKVYAWLARAVTPDVRRMDRLGVRHHMLVAEKPPGIQREWLNRAADAADGPWTVARMGAEMKAGGVLVETAWWVIVATAGADEQAKLIARMQAEGLSAKPLVRRKRRGKETR
jgi:hypothetical protein